MENIKRFLVSIDEFQQIGEFADSLTVQKRLRGVWQHHQHVSYCFFGSKSNVDRIKKCLIDRELITIEKEGVFLADCVFELWFKREMM